MGKPLAEEEVKERIQKLFVEDVELVGSYINRRTPVELHCKDCDHKWNMSPQNFLYSDSRAKVHHCPNCEKNNTTSEEKYCAFCGKKIIRAKSRIEKNESGFFYCSRECGNRHKNQLREEKGEWIESKQYRLKALKRFPHKCACCGYDEDERILEVHHIDKNRSNNSLENLIILCPNCHRKITLGYYSLDVENKKLISL